MILIRYRDWSIYWLYDRKSDSIIVSESINFNDNLLTDENTENNEITNQSSIFKIKLFTEFFNEKIFDSSDSMSESVRDKAEAKKNAMKISSSQEEMLIMRHERLKKKIIFVNRVILLIKILE